MARRRGTGAALARGEELPFRAESFGTVFLIVTLCFVASPFAVLVEARRVLKEGGKVALGMVLRESPWGRRYQAGKRRGHRFYRHATVYSYRDITGLLDRAGFRVESVVSTLFQPPGEVEHTEAPRQGLFKDAGFTIIVADRMPAGPVQCRRPQP